MRISSFLFLLLSASFCGAQAQGNSVVYDTTTTTGPVANEIHSAAFSSPTLQTLLNACPASPTPCYIVLDPSSTAITIGSTPAVIGSTTQQVIVEDRGVAIECTGTAGADCIDIAQWGSLTCAKKGPGSPISGCNIYSSSTADITSLVTNAVHTGAQSDFELQGWNIIPNNSATVVHAGLWIVAVEGKGFVRDVAVLGMVGTNGSCAGNASGTYCSVSLEDGPATGDNNNLEFDNDYFDCTGKAGCVSINLISGAGTGSGGNFVFNDVSVGDGDQGSGCISGAGCMINIDGSVGGTMNSHYVSTIIFNGLYLESTTGASGNFIEVKNAKDVEFHGALFNGGPALTDGLAISHSGAGYTGLVTLTGRLLGGRASNIIDNKITGYISGNTGADINYIYPGDTSTGAYVDGPVVAGAGAAGATWTSTAGVPSANCTVGSFDTNTSASSASTVLYVCYPANTWTAVTVP
jgi:hypothetical protein